MEPEPHWWSCLAALSLSPPSRCLALPSPFRFPRSNNLDLTKQDISGASIATVTGAVFSRILLGAVCDSYGPRYGHGVLQLLCSAATFGIAAINNAGGFIACRM